MNTTSPIRVTQAFWLALFTLLSFMLTLGSFLLNLPFVYIVALPTTLVLFLFTCEAAHEVKARARRKLQVA